MDSTISLVSHVYPKRRYDLPMAVSSQKANKRLFYDCSIARCLKRNDEMAHGAFSQSVVNNRGEVYKSKD
jgi:hypothetical protein